MNYVALYKEDYSNGEGRRVTLFVSGCSHGCNGCHNAPAQNPKMGKPFSEDTLKSILTHLAAADGFTITGGDPMYPKNRKPVTELLRAIKEVYPKKNIWMWTGYTHSDIINEPVLQFIDVLIDGKYDKSRPPASWRGSDNQNIIMITKTGEHPTQ